MTSYGNSLGSTYTASPGRGMGQCPCRGMMGLGEGDFTRSPVFVVAMGLAVLGIGFYFTRARA